MEKQNSGKSEPKNQVVDAKSQLRGGTSPFETEYNEFKRLLQWRVAIPSANKLLEREPNLCLWMDSTEVAFCVSQAMRFGIAETEARQLYRTATDIIGKARSTYKMPELEPLVKKLGYLEEAGDPEVNPKYNEFLHHVQHSKFREAHLSFEETPAISESITLGCAIYLFGKFLEINEIGQVKATAFLKTMQDEFGERANELINMSSFVEISQHYQDTKALPPDIRRMIEGEESR